MGALNRKWNAELELKLNYPTMVFKMIQRKHWENADLISELYTDEVTKLSEKGFK